MWDIETHHTCETHISRLTIYVTQISTTLTLDVGHTRVTLNHTWDTHINTHVWNISTGTIHVRYTTTHMWGTPHSTFMWDTHTSNSPYRWDAQIHTTHLGHTFQHSMFMWDTNINTSRSCGTHISTLTIHLRRVYINTHHSHGTNISTLTIHVGHTCIRTHHTHEAHSYDERSSYKIWAESSRGKCHTR